MIRGGRPAAGQTGPVRIATWNLRAGGPGGRAAAGQVARLRQASVDVAVLTEVPARWQWPPYASLGVPAGPMREGPAAWVGIFARGLRRIDRQPPPERMAAAARVVSEEGEMVIYASVLPWMSAPAQVPHLAAPGGESSAEMFSRVLADQAADVGRLIVDHPRLPVFWVGGFHQSLAGPNRGGTETRRRLLAAALSRLGLVAYNSTAPGSDPPTDMVCGPRLAVGGTGRIDPAAGQSLADPAGYWVEVNLGDWTPPDGLHQRHGEGRGVVSLDVPRA